MAAHLEDNPAARAVVNFTPRAAGSAGRAGRPHARAPGPGSAAARPRCCVCWGRTRCPPSPRARLALLKSCLRANRKNLMERFKPFLDLVTCAENCASLERICWVSDTLLHDLAVWYHLAWMGETVRRSDPRVAALSSQSSGFTAAQRRQLLELIGELVGGIIPRYGGCRSRVRLNCR